MARVEGDYSAELNYVIRGFHVYQNIWVPQLGEVHDAVKEDANIHDRFAAIVRYLYLTIVSSN